MKQFALDPALKICKARILLDDLRDLFSDLGSGNEKKELFYLISPEQTVKLVIG